jgi:hypothetical protein
MNDEKFLLARYSALTNMWTHHNSMQLQWPAIVISAALVVISIAIPGQLSAITNTVLWGRDASLAFNSGIPLLLTGLGIITILYMMGRGQKIMNLLESEISEIEIKLGKTDKSFKEINRPEGFSGRKLARFYMIIFLALPTIFFGFSFIFGKLIGVIGFVIVSLVWLLGEQYPTILRRRDKTRGKIA